MHLSITTVRELMFFIEACKTVSEDADKWVPSEKIWGIIENALEEISKQEATQPQFQTPINQFYNTQSSFKQPSTMTVDPTPLLSSPGEVVGGSHHVTQRDTFITDTPREVGSRSSNQDNSLAFNPAHDAIPGIGS